LNYSFQYFISTFLTHIRLQEAEITPSRFQETEHRGLGGTDIKGIGATIVKTASSGITDHRGDNSGYGS